jgi:ABC-type transporter Mla subunit MlaD
VTGDDLEADLDDLGSLADRLRTLIVELGSGGMPASGPPWQATAVAADGVHADVDAASQALGARIGDTAAGVDGATAQLASSEGLSSDMLSSVGDVVSAVASPSADLGGAVSGTVGDITGALTGAVADITGAFTGAVGDLSGAVSGPLGSLAGAVDFTALADAADAAGSEPAAVVDAIHADLGAQPVEPDAGGEGGQSETGEMV